MSDQKNLPVTVDKQAGEYLQAFGRSLEEYAIREYNHNAFLKSAMLCIVSNPDVAACLKTDDGRLSLFNALRYASTTGLSLNPQEGKAAIIAYGGKVQYQVMKNGMIDLAMDSGKVEFISADYVRKNDHFEIQKTVNGDTYTFEPALENRGDLRGFYAALRLKGGFTHVKWMTVQEVEEIRDNYSAMFKAKPEVSSWKKSFIGMGVKTVMKSLLRSVSISDALDMAVGADDFYNSDHSAPSPGVSADAAADKLKSEGAPPPKAEAGQDKNGSLL